MARWTDLADWQGETVNQGGAMGRIRMLVVHIEQGSNTGSIAWCKNPASKVSAHFFNPEVRAPGPARRHRPRRMAEVDYNSVAVSVEHEGNSGDQPSPAASSRTPPGLLARAHQAYGIPLRVLNDPRRIRRHRPRPTTRRGRRRPPPTSPAPLSWCQRPDRHRPCRRHPRRPRHRRNHVLHP